MPITDFRMITTCTKERFSIATPEQLEVSAIYS